MLEQGPKRPAAAVGGAARDDVPGGGASTGESGKGSTGAAASTTTTTVTVPQGTTTIDESLRIEVELLGLAALEEIGATVAHKVAAKALGARVVLGDERLLEAVRMHAGVRARIRVLRESLEGLVQVQQIAPDILGGATALVDSAAKLLSYFRADVSYQGRAFTIDTSALPAILAGRLTAAGVSVVLPQQAPASAGEIVAELATLAQLKNEALRRQPSNDAEKARIDGLAAAVDALLALVFPSGQASGSPDLLSTLLAADGVASLLDEQNTLLLTAKVVASGGSYRTRRHLFTLLFTGDRLAYSGGAAVAYFLTRPSTMEVVLADMLYYCTAHTRFSSRNTTHDADNLTANNRIQ